MFFGPAWYDGRNVLPSSPMCATLIKKLLTPHSLVFLVGTLLLARSFESEHMVHYLRYVVAMTIKCPWSPNANSIQLKMSTFSVRSVLLALVASAIAVNAAKSVSLEFTGKFLSEHSKMMIN